MNPETRTARTTIGRKLILLFAGICIAFFAIIGFAVWHIHTTGDELRVLAESQVPALSANGRAQAAIFHQQQIADDFVAVPTADAAARFREAGLPAQFLTDDSDDARKFRQMIESSIAKEKTHGHVDSDEADALSVEKLAEAYRTFQGKAASLFAATTPGQAHAEGDQAGDELMKRLQKFDRTLLGFVAEDTAELLATERNLVLLLVIASVVVLGTALVVSVRFVARITEPLATLTRLSARIADGDLGTKPDIPATGDEIEILAASFDSMGRSLRSQIEEIRKGSELLSAAISEIGASIQEQAASAKEEAATIQEITTTMQEIQQSGSEISQRAKEVSIGAESTLDAGEDGLEAVRKTSESMERIRDQVEEVAEKIVGLSEKTQAIGEIVATVNEIAEQSNILAINASIEAASAGESGSRFSVVAQEMKHLADQAKSSTRMVRGILEEIQKGINTSVMLTEEAVKRTESGRAQAGLAQSNIHKLAEQIRGSVQTFGQIIAGTGQQQIGINQVVQGMQDIKQAVQQTVAGITQLEQATRSLGDMGSNLRASIARYKL